MQKTNWRRNGIAHALQLRMRFHILALLFAAPLWAQTVSFGGKIGLPFNDPTTSYGESRPYTIGPTVEVRLPAGFAIEGSALYRRYGQTLSYNYSPDPSVSNGPSVSTMFTNRVRGNAWEFPVIGKYYLGSPEARWQPFIGSGWSLRTVDWKSEGSVATTTSGVTQVNPFKSSDRSDLGVGATVAAGVRVRTGRFSLVPEIRYTRWGRQDGFQRRNEGGVFLGFRF
jgi:hypothetical protein